ncbi:MAG: hypothetical protein ABUL69_01315, partial [Peristeroidobacter soli]
GSLQQIEGVDVVASDLSYGPGLVEAYVPIEQLLNVAHTKGVLAIVPTSPMETNVGSTDSQGIIQHRVDKLPAGVDGSGITVGVMSDSYDTNAAPNSAALDIASGDLPGTGTFTSNLALTSANDSTTANNAATITISATAPPPDTPPPTSGGGGSSSGGGSSGSKGGGGGGALAWLGLAFLGGLLARRTAGARIVSRG